MKNNILIFILFLYKIINKESLNIALCLVAKEENNYIMEFVKYYKNIGINKIFLYDNNNIYGETFDFILYKYIKKNFIQVINFRGLKRPQLKAYTDCYENNKNKFDWIAFYDADEYLSILNHRKLQSFLKMPRFKNCSSLLINWKYYGDNNNLFYEKKQLKERFTKPFVFSNKTIYDKYLYGAGKSIVRGNLNIKWAHFPHFLNDSNICRPNGEIVKDPLSPPQYSIAHIKHYATKSTEEYCNKLKKGNAYSNNSIKNYIIERIKNYYFFLNKITAKKIKLFEKNLNLTLNIEGNAI